MISPISLVSSTNIVNPFLVKLQILREIEEARDVCQIITASADPVQRITAISRLSTIWLNRQASANGTFECLEPVLSVRAVVLEEIRRHINGLILH